MTPEIRGLIRACAAIVETAGRVDLALRLLALIPTEYTTTDTEGETT